VHGCVPEILSAYITSILKGKHANVTTLLVNILNYMYVVGTLDAGA